MPEGGLEPPRPDSCRGHVALKNVRGSSESVYIGAARQLLTPPKNDSSKIPPAGRVGGVYTDSAQEQGDSANGKTRMKRRLQAIKRGLQCPREDSNLYVPTAVADT